MVIKLSDEASLKTNDNKKKQRLKVKSIKDQDLLIQLPKQSLFLELNSV